MEKLSNRSYLFWSILYSYGNLFYSFFIGVLVVPLYFKYFSFEEYGVWLGANSIVSIFLLFDFGLTFFLPKKIASGNGKLNRSVLSWINSGLLMTLIVSLLLTCLILFLVKILGSNFLNRTSWDYFNVNVFLFILYLVSQLLNIFFISLVQGLGDVKFMSIFNLLLNIVGIGVTLFLLHFKFGVQSLLLTTIFKNLIIVFSFYLYYFKVVNSKFFRYHEFNLLVNQIWSTNIVSLLSELVKQLPGLVLGSYSPTTLSSLRITTTIPDISRSIVERPFYHLIFAMNSKSKLFKFIGDIGFLKLLISFTILTISFFSLFLDDILLTWIRKIPLLDNYLQSTLILYIFCNFLNKFFLYFSYSTGLIKEVNSWLAYYNILPIFALVFLFNVDFLPLFFITLIIVDLVITVRLIKESNLDKDRYLNFFLLGFCLIVVTSIVLNMINLIFISFYYHIYIYMIIFFITTFLVRKEIINLFQLKK